MRYFSARLGSLVCVTTLLACNPSEGGSEDASTGAASTSGASDPQTGGTGPTTTDSTGDGTGSASEPTTTPDPTTGPMTTTTASETTRSSDPDTGSDTTGSTTESSETSETTSNELVTASATLEPRSDSQAMGSALFTDVGGGIVDLVIMVSGVEPPGTHALHIHEFPDCSAPDGTSTGNHWNPPPTMLGELGTIEIGDDGTGVFMKSDMWSIGTGETNDVVAHSIIIHAEANGGARIACGVIAQD